MGTTYQAQVEVFFPADKEAETVDIWQSVSRWELQKDYEFSMAYGQIAEEGWPTDHSRIIGEREEFLEGRRWTEGVLFACLEYDAEWDWFAELRTHVTSLIQRGYKVRVLTWDE
jgi:hypothetical protein